MWFYWLEGEFFLSFSYNFFKSDLLNFFIIQGSNLKQIFQDYSFVLFQQYSLITEHISRDIRCFTRKHESVHFKIRFSHRDWILRKVEIFSLWKDINDNGKTLLYQILKRFFHSNYWKFHWSTCPRQISN